MGTVKNDITDDRDYDYDHDDHNCDLNRDSNKKISILNVTFVLLRIYL